jgi:MFS family permease
MTSVASVTAGFPRAFWVLFVGTLINRIGGFVLTFLAIYLTEVRSLSIGQTGAIVSCYGVGAIGAALTGGILADRIGRRPTLVGALMLGGAAMLLLGFARSLPEIAVMAALTGLLYELYRPVVSATVADLVAPEDRPRAYSLIYWAVNAGASVAPLIGGLIAARSYHALFVGDAATTFMYGLIVWKALPETRPAQHAHAGDKPPAGLRIVWRDRRFMVTCVLLTALCVIFFQSFTVLPLDVRAHGISTAGFGVLMAVNGVLIVLLQPFAGGVIRGRSRFRVLALAALLIGTGVGLNALAGTLPWYACAVVVWTLGEILYSPAGSSLAADLAPIELRGRYQGVLSMSFSAGFFLAPLVGGWAAGAFGFPIVWTASLAAGIVTAVGFLVLGESGPTRIRKAAPRGRM